MLGGGFDELFCHVSACHTPVGVNAQEISGVVVDEVQDFCVGAVGEAVVGEI